MEDRVKKQARAMRVEMSELELLDRKVTQDGGSVRYLEGAAYGLMTSLFRSEIRDR